MHRRLLAGAAGLLLTLLPAGPADAATVTVRVEGGSQTILRQTQVTTSADVVVDKTAQGGTTCSGTSGGGALELAVKGDWGGRVDPQGQRVERIGAETYLLGQEYAGRYWSLYVNNKASFQGLCAYEPQTGDEILLSAGCGGATTACGGEPLELTGPATAAPGQALTVKVAEWSGDASAASEGATVTGGGQTATTDASGAATVTLAERGPAELVANKQQDLFGDTVPRTRDELTVCVTDGADGFCGTTAPDGTTQPQTPEPQPTATPCATTGDDGLCGTADKRAPQARISGITEQRRYTRRGAPREIVATVAEDPSGLQEVRLSLTRTSGRRCSALDGKRERFVKAKCWSHPSFVVGDRAEVSYLLPSRLAKGRYVLDVIAVDKAGNRDALARGRNRVVFYVK